MVIFNRKLIFVILIFFAFVNPVKGVPVQSTLGVVDNSSVVLEDEDSELETEEPVPQEDNSSDELEVNENNLGSQNQVNDEIDNNVKPDNKVPTVIGKPSRFLIPKISVDAPVDHLGLTPQGKVEAPDDAYHVSWFTLGPKPGEQGSALISGHYGIWKDGAHSVFDNLHTLKTGDIIQVKDDNGNTINFKVTDMKVYNKDQIVPELFEESDESKLNIITCHGKWLGSQQTYSQRLVVFTEKVIL